MRRAPRDKRAAIVEAALAVFSERTVDGARMPAVAKRAGVAVGTIYRFFESKEALANAVYREAKAAMGRTLAEAAAEAGGTRAEFRGLWRGLWEFQRKHPAAFRFLETHHHERYLDDRSRAASDAVLAGVSDYVRRAQAAGAVRAAPPALLIALAFGAFTGLVKEAEAGHLALNETSIAEAEEALWALLRAPEP